MRSSPPPISTAIARTAATSCSRRRWPASARATSSSKSSAMRACAAQAAQARIADDFDELVARALAGQRLLEQLVAAVLAIAVEIGGGLERMGVGRRRGELLH